jgi:hypothetical protein
VFVELTSIGVGQRAAHVLHGQRKKSLVVAEHRTHARPDPAIAHFLAARVPAALLNVIPGQVLANEHVLGDALNCDEMGAVQL